MTRPLLLDLFCGEGGAAMGFHRAGFDVIGVDIVEQPRYPFPFLLGDALGVESWAWPSLGYNFPNGIAAVHAAPPCQHASRVTHVSGDRSKHPRLIEPTRELLLRLGLPWTLENVPGADLREPVTYCARSFGLGSSGYLLRRHRLFESSLALVPPPCGCYRGDGPTLGVYGGGPTTKPRLDGGGGRPRNASADEAREAMGMPWASKHGCIEATPPAYTLDVGRQLLAHLDYAAAA